jgi:putative tryptophan/tyrosine transport system substrate-binding protein
MNRRVFLSAVTGGLLAAPLAAAAPPAGKVLRLGLLYGIKPKFDPGSNPVDRALVDGLRAQGYEPGRNIIFEFRSAEGNPERLPALAAELVQLKVDVLVTSPTAPTSPPRRPPRRSPS